MKNIYKTIRRYALPLAIAGSLAFNVSGQEIYPSTMEKLQSSEVRQSPEPESLKRLYHNKMDLATEEFNVAIEDGRLTLGEQRRILLEYKSAIKYLEEYNQINPKNKIRQKKDKYFQLIDQNLGGVHLKPSQLEEELKQYHIKAETDKDGVEWMVLPIELFVVISGLTIRNLARA